MFESDDFDQVLSQFEFPDLPVTNKVEHKVQNIPEKKDPQFKSPTLVSPDRSSNLIYETTPNNTTYERTQKSCQNEILTKESSLDTPKHSKRKMLSSLFDTRSKRKFPGPAGLLTGSLEESKDDNICHMELLSQDIDFSQNNMRRDVFESPLWSRLVQDIKNWDLGSVDNIKTIKQLALSGNLQKGKAQTVTAMVEAVDRSASNPLVVLRDTSGSIKCTLHQDAWTTFAPYIASEFCALVLWKPTVLTTGGAFKKHYLNITLSNIYALYSSAVLKDEDESKTLPDRYAKVYEEDFTVIKTDTVLANDSANNTLVNMFQNGGNDDLLDGLDSSLFLEENF